MRRIFNGVSGQLQIPHVVFTYCSLSQLKVWIKIHKNVSTIPWVLFLSVVHIRSRQGKDDLKCLGAYFPGQPGGTIVFYGDSAVRLVQKQRRL